MSVDWSKPIRNSRRMVRDLGKIKRGPEDTDERAVIETENGIDCGDPYLVSENNGESVYQDSSVFNVPPRKRMRELEAWAIIDGEDHEIMLATFNKAIADRNAGTYTVVRLTGAIEVEVEE